MPDEPEAESFSSMGELREANAELLDEFSTLDYDELPADFLVRIDAFRSRAALAGRILATADERAEAQSAINFWTTLLFSGGRRPASIILEPFDREEAGRRAGQAPPYKGLESFQTRDFEKFFGRDALVDEMVAKLQENRLLAIVGSSGSGKSSVVRAGLIPRLAGAAAGSASDRKILDAIVPGKAPLAALQSAAREVHGSARSIRTPADFVAALDRAGKPALVVVDQFEEIFTLVPRAREEERRLFIDSLVAAATEGEHRHVVLLTMRMEFEANLPRYPGLAKLWEAGRIRVAALSAKELRAAVEGPAARAGVEFEPGLVDDLVDAVLGEQAGLPLLQFTLLELWKSRSSDNRITRASYEALGGNPRDILAHRADQVFDSFKTIEAQNYSKDIFVALVEIGSGLEPTARRVVRSELDYIGPPANVDEVLHQWESNGLIRISPLGAITPASQVELAHEALIRNWNRLVKWVREENASALSHGVLAEQARAWHAAPHRKDLLLGELSLIDVSRRGDLTDEEEAYVEASRREVAHEKAILRRNRYLAGAGIAAAVMLLAYAGDRTLQASQTYDRLEQQTKELRIEQGKLKEANRVAKTATEQVTRVREKAQEDIAEAEGKLRKAQGKLADHNRRLAALQAHSRALHQSARTFSGQLEKAKTDMVRLGEEAEEAERSIADSKQFLSGVAAHMAEAKPAIPLTRLRTGPPRLWSQLGKQRETIERLARSVGRVRNGPLPATAFLVDEGIAASITYMDEEFESATIDFREVSDGDTSHDFAVERVLEQLPGPDVGTSIVLLKLAPKNAAGETLPPPLSIARPRPGTTPEYDYRIVDEDSDFQPGRQLYLVGYPMEDMRIPEEIRKKVLGGVAGAKRVQPGLLMDWKKEEDAQSLFYDVTTFQGNIGSPIVDLATGKLIGIHFTGSIYPSYDTRQGIAMTASLAEAAARARRTAEAPDTGH